MRAIWDTRRGGVSAIAVVLALGAFALLVVRPRTSLPGEWNASADGVAIDGYDAVAYFVVGKATRGSPEITHRWRGAEWRFTSNWYRDLFARDPEQYAPQFGGFCAGGMSLGRVIPADPEVWAIVEGRLYLTFDGGAREDFQKHLEENIARAQVEWRHKFADYRIARETLATP